MGSLLLVDDDEKILSITQEYLTQEGYEIHTARDGLEALERIQSTPEIRLIVLDWLMPGKNGLDVCKQIRSFTDIPIIFLTAKSEEIDKIIGLEIGADDYMTKPFSVRELAARIRVLLRRYEKHRPKFTEDRTAANEILQRGELVINLQQHTVTLRNEEITLTPTEFKILHALANSPGRVYSRLQLLDIALGQEYLGYERSIDTHVSNLRRKIESDPANPRCIMTVFGIGYKFGDVK